MFRGKVTEDIQTMTKMMMMVLMIIMMMMKMMMLMTTMIFLGFAVLPQCFFYAGPGGPAGTGVGGDSPPSKVQF